MEVVLSPVFVESINAPFVFLAGPISCAERWQSTAVDLINRINPSVVVASPRDLYEDRFRSRLSRSGTMEFPRQRAWERHYMELAARHGCLLFWLARQSDLSSHAFAATTRFELGQWTARFSLDRSLSIRVGAEQEFQALNVIKYDLSLDMPNLEVYESLEQLCFESVRIAESRYEGPIWAGRPSNLVESASEVPDRELEELPAADD